MSALAIAMVKNEADIIEAFVRHNLHFVDLLVVIDNQSTDGTREILQALRREGLPLLVVDDPVFGHFQSEKVTLVYRKVAPVFQPELVYLLDADEFLRAPSRGALETVLGDLHPGTVALLPWMTYLPVTECSAEQVRADPLGAMTRRRRREEPTYYKAVIRRRAEDDSTLVIEQGNHAAHLAAERSSLVTVTVQGAALAHIPVRSVDQLSAKVINGWQACMVRNRHRHVPGEAYQWQALYEHLVQGHTLSTETLAEVALGYAQQPRSGRNVAADAIDDPVLARYGALRYLGLGRHAALAKVALSHEAYLRHQNEREAQHGLALDLAPVCDLLSSLPARSLAATPAGRAWLTELRAIHPELSVTNDCDADVLLAPELSLSDSLMLAAQSGGSIGSRVLSWPDRARSSDELRQELEAWAGHGFEPDLLQSMAFRALASYAAVRHGALILRPVKSATGPRSSAVRELLCTMANAPHFWIDPRSRRIRYPLETLDLGMAALHQPAAH